MGKRFSYSACSALVSCKLYDVFSFELLYNADDSSTCVISLIRLSTLSKGIHTQDPCWDNAPAAYWSVIELNCGIMCACLPTLRPLAQKYIPRLVPTSYGSGGGSVQRVTARSQ